MSGSAILWDFKFFPGFCLTFADTPLPPSSPYEASYRSCRYT